MKDQSLIEEKFPQFLRLVQNASGWIHVCTLCEILDLPSSSIRRLRRHAQRLGLPLASGKKGYAYGEEFMEDTYRDLWNRAIDMLTTIKKNKQFDKEQFILELETKLGECHAS